MESSRKICRFTRTDRESFPGEYYKKFLPDLVIQQNRAMLEALNVDAIVHESTPYLVAIYTAGLGGTTPESSEISGVGLYQLGELASCHQ